MQKIYCFLSALILLTLAILPTQNAHAQLAWEFGLVGGMDFAGAQTAPSPFPGTHASGATGYMIGVRSVNQLVGPVGIQSELLITQRSFKDTYTLNNYKSTSWIENSEYIQIPVMLRVTPIEGDVQLYGFLGPDFSLKIAASATTDSTGSSQTTDRGSIFNGFSVGADLGLGVEVKIAPLVSLAVDGRFTYGFTNVLNSLADNKEGDLRGLDFKWLAGVMFHI
jgi:hypothetical protein